jgi:hypothetical protein
MRILFFILILIIASFSYSQEQKRSSFDVNNFKTAIQNGVSDSTILNQIEIDSTISKVTKINVLEDLISYACSMLKYDLAFEMRKMSISFGQADCLILEDQLAQYIRMKDTLKYNQLEQEFYNKYNAVRNQFFPHSNLELSLQLHKMIRLDQRSKYLAESCSDSLLQASLWNNVRVQDSLNEVSLAHIFDEYGYPGKSLVGGQDLSIAYILMLHMSTDFQIRNVHLVEKAILEEELYSNLEFLVDKILYKCCRKSIYGNWVGKGLAELVTDSKEILLLKEKLHLRIDE